MDNEESENYIEEYIRELDYGTEILESFAASLNALGYLIISYGAEIDIYDIITNNEVDITSAEVTVLGQLLIAIGYCLLWIVSIRRIYSRHLRNEYLNENNYLPAYKALEDSYLLSVLANLLRFQAFFEILLNRYNNSDDNYE